MQTGGFLRVTSIGNKRRTEWITSNITKKNVVTDFDRDKEGARSDRIGAGPSLGGP